ncbi:MAG: hypothetical protein QM762_00890 [Chryseolinea sp.]
MRYYLTVVFAAIGALQSFAQLSEKKIPSDWAKDFVIEFSYTGSMDGSHTKGRITYDSCVVVHQGGHKTPVRGTYLMKANDRSTILRKLQELKADQIESEASVHVVNDGYSQLIRIGDIYLSAGPAYELTEDSRQRFGQVYRYLEEFAFRKTNPK